MAQRKIRVLVVNCMFFNAHYRRCAEELGKLHDIELTVLTADKWMMNSRYYSHDPLTTGSPYNFVVGRGIWFGKENRAFYISGLIEAFKLSRPDVIYLMEEPFSLFALQILTLRAVYCPQTPVVFFTWNNLSLEKFDYRPSIWYRTVARWSLGRMDYAVTANTDAIQVLRSARFHNPIKLVGYALDTAIHRSVTEDQRGDLRKKLNIPDDTIIVGYAGRLILMKGIDLLLSAFSKVVATSGHKVVLLLVGSGSDEVKILHRAEELGIRDKIHHIPTVPQSEMPYYMAIFDLFILPSRRVGMWAEQFGRVLVESMASRSLIIGSSSGAIPEVIGDAGFIFQENNEHDLFEKMKMALNLSTPERDIVLKRGEVRASKIYSWEAFAQNSVEAIRFVYDKQHSE
jgi:L-malate glycosyltransferase